MASILTWYMVFARGHQPSHTRQQQFLVAALSAAHAKELVGLYLQGLGPTERHIEAYGPADYGSKHAMYELMLSEAPAHPVVWAAPVQRSAIGIEWVEEAMRWRRT